MKSPNIFFRDIADDNDAFYDKCLEGFNMFALNQGEVCTCPSRALIDAPIYDKFLADCIVRTKAITQGNPLDTNTMLGAQVSNDQMEKILSYIEIGKQEGAKLALGGKRADLGGDLLGEPHAHALGLGLGGGGARGGLRLRRIGGRIDLSR